MADAEALARVLTALARDSGEPGQRAWAALAGMTTRICGRYSAEGRAVTPSPGELAPDILARVAPRPQAGLDAPTRPLS